MNLLPLTPTKRLSDRFNFRMVSMVGRSFPYMCIVDPEGLTVVTWFTSTRHIPYTRHQEEITAREAVSTVWATNIDSSEVHVEVFLRPDLSVYGRRQRDSLLKDLRRAREVFSEMGFATVHAAQRELGDPERSGRAFVESL